MIETADILAKRYDVSPRRLRRLRAGMSETDRPRPVLGYYEHEIVPMDTIMTVKDKEKGTSEDIKYTVSKDAVQPPSAT